MTFELRTYTAADRKMGDVLTRFQNHTLALFPEHGMHSVGYWHPTGQPDVLIYLLRHDGVADENWESFKADPRWIHARADSVANGELTTSITSVYLEPTNFSPLA